jgi:hypothetical protein
MSRFCGAIFLVLSALLLNFPSHAQSGIPDPANDGLAHLGVTTCAGSTCHGKATTVKKTGVVQNEYLIWQSKDKHAKAYTALEGTLGRRIAANLGIGPATQSKECLVCHADNVSEENRGVQFRIDDGVGCEACHGGSQKWLGPHASGRIPHNVLLSDYKLYPTNQPVERAKLCLGCHLGDETHVISHRIMGAGHPRMPFELQTFTVIEPQHFVIDDKYRKRKPVAEGVQVWAIGQAIALQRLVTQLADHQGHEGAFPELVFFDCQSCHHPLTSLRWERRSSMGLGPGLPHFNDANGIMLRAIAARVAPELGSALENDIRALHVALSEGGHPAEVARRVAADADKLNEVFATHDFTAADMRAMMVALAQSMRNGDATDYAAAEQATMAFASILYTLHSEQAVDTSQYAALKAALDHCYAATQKPDNYDPRAFAVAAESVAGALQGS